MRVFTAGADSSKFLRLPGILNIWWQDSPPALKAADPVGLTTYTLLVFCVILRIEFTSVLIIVLLPFPATPDKVILKGLKVPCDSGVLASSYHFFKCCKMYANTFSW